VSNIIKATIKDLYNGAKSDDEVTLACKTILGYYKRLETIKKRIEQEKTAQNSETNTAQDNSLFESV
jgi:hypothetical protein